MPAFRLSIIALSAFALLLVGCGSAERRAIAAAQQAQQALASGQLQRARILIRRALAERDDMADYWLLLAQISIADHDLAGAYSAYENVLLSDRANVEALTRLCQLAITLNIPERAEKHAEQLALLSSDPMLPNTVRAGSALAQGQKDDAVKLLDEVLKARPNDLGALLIQARLHEADGDFAAAAGSIERSLEVGGDPAARLTMLLGYYRNSRDRAGYGRTLERQARAFPNDAAAQLAYADILYDSGERKPAMRVVQALLAGRPGDVQTASAIADLWLKQEDAVDATQVLEAGARAASLEIKATYAQYAADSGRTALAATILAGAAMAPLNPTTAGAKATLAYVWGLTGSPAKARAALDVILAGDSRQPNARLARGRLRAAAGERAGGVEDLRQVLADDSGNVAARIDLARIFLGNGDGILAEQLLREGMDVKDGDPRLAKELERIMVADGRRADAMQMLTEYARHTPLSLRAQRLAADAKG